MRAGRAGSADALDGLAAGLKGSFKSAGGPGDSTHHDTRTAKPGQSGIMGQTSTARQLAEHERGRAQQHMPDGLHSTAPGGETNPVDSGRVEITLKDVYLQQQDTTGKLTEAVHEINLSLTRILGHVEAQITTNAGVAQQIGDHENRLRRLEAWRYALPTAVILGLGSAVGTVLAWLQVIAHH